LPDEAPIELEKNNLVPSYRRICLAILKNDHNLTSLGFVGKKTKYYNDLKYIELKERAIKNKTTIQLKLW
jgi:predicted phosphoadenosine phosphosulfate sulfurtransferase